MKRTAFFLWADIAGCGDRCGRYFLLQVTFSVRMLPGDLHEFGRPDSMAVALHIGANGDRQLDTDYVSFFDLMGDSVAVCHEK